MYFFVFVDFMAFGLSKHWVMVQHYRLKWLVRVCFDNRTINNIQTFVSVMNIFAYFFSFFSLFIVSSCVGIMDGLSDRIHLYGHHICDCELSVRWQPVDL